MDELDEGRATLKDFQDNALFAVEYSITFRTDVRFVRPSFPPVVKRETIVHYLRTLTGEHIPFGEYLLVRPHQINRVSNIGVGGWHILSWPVL